ncbi:MAG: protein kinase, partial [Gemmatimonadales bacterium]|nr:protein kinase [Gemmatimonadales bacterium]
AALNHPNIVTVHSAGQIEGLLFYVMDYVRGESLRDCLAREKQLTAEATESILMDLAAALDAAGKAGVVHRDIKPENVLIEQDTGRALLVDFGIARLVAGDHATEITGEGVVLGTPTYMSPEQAAGEEVDSRSDLYGLGVLAYEMITGSPPFTGPHRLVVSRHLSATPEPIARRRPDCPPRLADITMRLLEKQPRDRWQAGEELRQAIQGTRKVPQRNRRRTLALVTVALLATATTVAVARRGDPGPPEGVNPRHSILVLPFNNLRNDPELEWLRTGSVSMLALNLSQWDDLSVVDQERVHDLLATSDVVPGGSIGLRRARRLARDAGVWTVVMGEFELTADSLRLTARVFDVASGNRVDLARSSAPIGDDVRATFDVLATRLLDLSGAPSEVQTDLAQATTSSVAAYRAYLNGVQHLNTWELQDAITDLDRAVSLDSAFGLAYYKLALARGWSLGTGDSISNRAMVLATRYSSGLPAHERKVIQAYRAFIEGDQASARTLYEELLAQNPGDADAWYGLGDSWFHQPGEDRSGGWTKSLRAFSRSLELDPGYALAFDHIMGILANAARPNSLIALMPGDSLVEARTKAGDHLLDSINLRQAAARARADAVRRARLWVASQPNVERAHNALIDAYILSAQHAAALGEITQARQTGRPRPDLPFREARVHLASGSFESAAEVVRGALDSVAASDFGVLDRHYDLVNLVAAGSNAFAYQGDITNAAQAVQFADDVRQTLYPEEGGPNAEFFEEWWSRNTLGNLYAATEAPAAMQRRVWDAVAETARLAPAEVRHDVAMAGAPAALGVFLSTFSDTTALVEFEALTNHTLAREVRALLALSRKDTTTARDILNEPGPGNEVQATAKEERVYLSSHYRVPLAGLAHLLLGDYQTTLDILHTFEPAQFNNDRFDPRWGMIGRVRVFRGLALQELGRTAEAEEQYRLALAQWTNPHSSLRPLIDDVEERLAVLGGTG